MSRSNLLSADQICNVGNEFTKLTSNLIKLRFSSLRPNLVILGQVLLSRDWIYYLEIKSATLGTNLTKSRPILLPWDQIYWVKIEFTKKISNLLKRDQI